MILIGAQIAKRYKAEVKVIEFLSVIIDNSR